MNARLARIILPIMLISTPVLPASAQQQDSSSSLSVMQQDTTPPVLRNGDVVSRALDESYPALLRNRGAGGTVQLRVFVSDAGKPDTVSLHMSTGLASLDGAALNVARKAEFSPARVAGAPIGAWIDMNLEYQGSPARHSVPPAVVPVENRNAVRGLLHSWHPADLRKERIGTSVALAVTVNRAGKVIDHEYLEPSCFESANQAALAAVRSLPFAAVPDTAPVGRETFATVSFGRDSVFVKLLGDVTPPDTMPKVDFQPRDRPTEARRPSLRNRPTVAKALSQHYPPHLASKAIGGTTVIHFYVEANGRVSYRTVSTSSSICDLDKAALAVSNAMRFNPAELNGRKVAVWVEIPIIFGPRNR